MNIFPTSGTTINSIWAFKLTVLSQEFPDSCGNQFSEEFTDVGKWINCGG